jgi:hypothetical protein
LPKSGRRAWHHCRMSSRKHRHHRAVRWRHKTNVLAPGLTDLNSQVGAGTDVKGYLIRAATKAGRPRASRNIFLAALRVGASSFRPEPRAGGLEWRPRRAASGSFRWPSRWPRAAFSDHRGRIWNRIGEMLDCISKRDELSAAGRGRSGRRSAGTRTQRNSATEPGNGPGTAAPCQISITSGPKSSACAHRFSEEEQGPAKGRVLGGRKW